MHDIFEIKTKKIQIKIAETLLAIVDPPLIKKVENTKAWDKLSKGQETMDTGDFVMKSYELQTDTIKMFIPQITDAFIEEHLPNSVQTVLVAKILELANENFGASIVDGAAEKK